MLLSNPFNLFLSHQGEGLESFCALFALLLGHHASQPLSMTLEAMKSTRSLLRQLVPLTTIPHSKENLG